MTDAAYFREQAARARRLAEGLSNHESERKKLHDLAGRYDENAEDIERGAEVRHPELLPTQRLV
jgi:hypothetical protein